MPINLLRNFKNAALLGAVLWQRLLDPVEHPLFQRTLQAPSMIRSRWRAVIAVAVLLLSAWICNLPIQYAPFESNIMLLILTFAVVGSSLYVGGWTFEISIAIGKERRQKTYELLCMLPAGAQGADWAISAACLHRNDALALIDWLRKGFTGALLFLFLIVLLFTSFIVNSANPIQLLGLILDVILLVIVSYTEHTQAVLLGTLIAMLLSHHGRLRFEVQFLSVISFLAAQILILVVALTAGRWIALSWSDQVALGQPWSSTMALSLLLFTLSRKCLIAMLWKLLNREWRV